jgi:transposase
MSKKERERKVVLTAYAERRYTLTEAAECMATSYRQAKRIWRRYKLEGDAGLIHKARGNSSKRAFNRDIKTAVLKLYHDANKEIESETKSSLQSPR